ncbi:hypothetical protein ACFLR1_04015 [Bacteroidota bacterium]
MVTRMYQRHGFPKSIILEALLVSRYASSLNLFQSVVLKLDVI